MGTHPYLAERAIVSRNLALGNRSVLILEEHRKAMRLEG
jgi:hypothetical protein